MQQQRHRNDAAGQHGGREALATAWDSTLGKLDSMDTCAAQAFTIIGGGRIGTALAGMGPGNDVVVQRGDPISGPSGPIVICTRNDVLQDIVDATPPERRSGVWMFL